MGNRDKKKYFNWRIAPLTVAILLFLHSCSSNQLNPLKWVRDVADDAPPSRTAFEIYSELQEAATSFNAKVLPVGADIVQEGMDGAGVTFGAEKEASSWLILKVMGPTGDSFKSYISSLPEENKKVFLKDFLTNYAKTANSYHTFRTEEGNVVDLIRDVKDVEGNPKNIDITFLRGLNFETMELPELEEKFSQLIDQMDGRPMSFLKPSVRSKFFKGTMPGLDGKKLPKNYSSFVPNFGKPQDYIRDAHGHGGGSGGWEINFNPQKSYGQFEEMILWFRTELKNAGKLFQAPGHQRLIFAKHPDLPEAKLAELYKAIQALIVVDGIKGKTGIENSNYKSVQSDSNLASLRTARGVIRLEENRFAQNSRGVEFRAGTKDIRLSRFYQTALSARMAANDFSGLADIGDWTLNGSSAHTADSLVERFGVSREVADKALTNIRETIKISYTVPLWGWDDPNVPFLSRPKRELIKSLTRDFIEQVAALEGSAEAKKPAVRSIMQSWTKSTRLSEELRDYIVPKRGFEMTEDLLHFSVNEERAARFVSNAVDVNNIDLGIEYSGKMPLRLQADFTAEQLEDNKKAWLRTHVDLTQDERKKLLKKTAEDLLKNLGGAGEATVVEADGHGHGLDIAYSIRDPQDRKWIVEWDGIGRSYTADGQIVEGSVRSGSVELVTPKFTPTVDDMSAVYKAFGDNNILPSLGTGGGHINVDLAAFDGKPKQLARFMSIFHEHRGVIALMFQNYNRMKAGEPVDVSSNLARQLKNFEGSEDDLKKLLYNEQYYNTRYKRKTRYIQLDLSAYFQDVIPEEFVTEDFDIASPTDPWRRQFRVDPNIRKAEFRMFNAPRDPAESALQIRLVRAMLSKALNEDGELSGAVQKVDHAAYADNPEKAFNDLTKLCDDLGLNINDFRPAVAEGLSNMDLAKRSIFYETLDSKLRIHPKQPGWGEAVTPRTEPLSSEGRHWSAGPADQQNTMTNQHYLRAAEEAQARRQSLQPNRSRGVFHRTESCIQSVGSFVD